MRRFLSLAVVLALAGLVWNPTGSTALAQSDQSALLVQTRTALDSLNQWLGQGKTGQGWREFLSTEELAKQMEKGSRADRGAVAKILERFSGRTPGLEHAHFVAVRQALRRWLDELNVPPASELPEYAQAARTQFQPIGERGLAHARTEMVSAVAALDRFLSAGPRQNAQQWREFLHWDQQQAELAKPAAPDLAALQAVLGKYSSGEVGMELPEFAHVRHSLRRYIDLASLNHNAAAQEQYEAQIDGLVAALTEYAKDPTPETSHTVGTHIGWLDRYGQSASLLDAVHQHYWQPNLTARVSSRLISSGIADSVDDKTDVTDVILGTQIQGTAQTKGNISVELIPNSQRAELAIRLDGVASSDNLGYNGPVTIHSKGVTQVAARKLLWIDGAGITSQRATARCTTNTTIDSIAARSRLVQNIAWKKAGQSEYQAESIASRHAEQRVANRMDAQAREMLDDANDRFRNKLRAPLMRVDAWPRDVAFQSDKENVNLTITQVNGQQLAAASPPPSIQFQEADLAMQLHQSWVANLAEAAIGGRKLTDEKLAQLAEDLTGEVPEELKIAPDKDPWSITFATLQPVILALTDQGFRVAIRGREFERSEQPIRETMEIAATYKIEKTDEGARLTRQGDLEVIYLNRKGTLGVSQIAFKTFLSKKFSAMFKEEFVTKGIVPKGRWEKIGKLSLEEIVSGDGWIRLAWKQVPRPEAEVAERNGE